jgi:hypothetical protein
MERETKTFTTKGGHEIVHKTYVTGRESNEIQKVLLKDVKIEAGMGTKLSPFMSGFSAASITELNNKTIEILVVSVDGKKENVLDIVLDLPNTDYSEVVTALNEITGEKKN